MRRWRRPRRWRRWPEAAAAAPHRFEPYVLCSRLARRVPGLDSPVLQLERARLRRRGLPVPPEDAEPAEPGAGLPVARDAVWLRAALAEYERHAAEAAGALPGYRAATLRRLRALHGGRLAHQGLAGLAQMPGERAAYVLRAKGGFVLAALRAVVGAEAFARLLDDVAGLGPECPLDTYLFFALASRAHGASLTWFARQWVCEEAELILAAEAAAAPGAAGAYRLDLRARCLGVAVPGAPVTYAVDLAGGSAVRLELNLDLGLRDVALELPARPLRVRPDPDAHWYASTVAATLESRHGPA